MKILKQFIREEATWSYWMRRPRNNNLGDVSDVLSHDREEMLASAQNDAAADVQRLRHQIAIATDISKIRDAINDFGEQPSDIASDPTAFSRAVKERDIDEIRRQLLSGLERWETEMLKWSDHDDYDTSTLSAHPMRSVKLGGNSFKRPNGP